MRFGLRALIRSALPALGSSLLLALAVACDGTDGTLVVRHDAGAGGSAVAPDSPYIPAENASWLVQLDGPVAIERTADFFYLDAELQAADDLRALHAAGRHYLCYLSAGTLESFRGDASEFPESVVGNQVADFPRERWLDVRSPAVRELMASRVVALAGFGCDGVTPSSLAVHVADTSFALTLDDALDYSRWIAERIHAAGMSAGLSGPADMTSELWPTFDFGLAIGCLAGTQCAEYAVLSQAKKPVLHIELGDEKTAPALCKSAQRLGFEALISDPEFAGQCTLCRDIL